VPNKVIHSPKGRTPCDVRRNSGKRNVRRTREQMANGRICYIDIAKGFAPGPMSRWGSLPSSPPRS